MSSIGFLLAALGVLVVYEGVQHFKGTTASAAVPPATGGVQSGATDYATLAQQHSAVTGIPASVYQAIINSEAGPGARPTNSLFGIKCTNPPCYSSPTWEMVNGQRVDTVALFQAYPTPNDAFNAFDTLAISLAGPFTGNVRGWLNQLTAAGYAT